MAVTYEFSPKSLDQRLNRIIGQLKGIQKMVKEERDSNQIIQQVSAVKKAIDSLTNEVVLSDVMDYIPPIKQKHIKDIIERAISL